MQRVSGFAEQGAKVVWTQSYASANVFQETYPFAKISVYVTGTTTLATLFGDNNTPPTPLANPFTADENGWWWFYAPNGRYDIQIWPRTSPPDVPWTIGDVLVADYAVTIKTGAIDLDNGVCAAHIGFDASCNILFTGQSGNNLLTLSQQGDLSIPGRLQAASLELNNGVCSTTISFAAACEILVTGQSGNTLASLDQNGDFTTAGCIYTPCLFVSGNASIGGNLSTTGGANIGGNLTVGGQITAPTPGLCLHVNCLIVDGAAVFNSGLESHDCILLNQGSGPRMSLCVDASGTFHILDNSGGDFLSMTQGGIVGVRHLNVVAATGDPCALNVTGDICVTGSINTGSLNATGNINTDGLLLVHGASFGPPGGPGGPVWQTWTPIVWDWDGTVAPLVVSHGYYLMWGNFALIQIGFQSSAHLGSSVVGLGDWYISLPFQPANPNGFGQHVSLGAFAVAGTQDAIVGFRPGYGWVIDVNTIDVPANSSIRVSGVLMI